jgi:ribosomal protein S18 acetylase RimI-like enzyme/bacterioferritin-associated ferredoxin
MPAIELLSTRVERGAGTERLVGAVRLADGKRREIYFAVAPAFGPMLHDAADAFVPALVVPAMAQGVDLRLRPPVSRRLLGQLATAQDVVARFHGFRRARVTAQPRGEDGAPASATAAYFSGGVDSSFTLLRSRQGAIGGTPPAEYLLFFKGLEQPLSALRDVSSSIDSVARVAALTGTRLVAVETNLRDVFDPDYELYYCGAALASASLALAFGIGTVLVPASLHYGWMPPFGSHPMLDELWSTERQRIVPAGAESRRVDKVEALVREWPASLQWLRVCLENSGGGSNCGRCRKCARTMAALAALGALEQARQFPPVLSRAALRELAHDHGPLLEELSELAHRAAPDQPITTAIDRTLARARRRVALHTLLENTPLAEPVFRRARRLKRGLRYLLRGGPPEEAPRLLRRVHRLREVSRRHGAAGAVRWAWNSRSADRSLLLFFGLARPPVVPQAERAAVEARLATAGDVERMTAADALEPESPARLAAGDACLLQSVAGTLVGWAWLSTRSEVDLVPGVVLTVPPDAAYVYSTWTEPAARGRGLQPLRTLRLFAECRRRGRGRLLCFVDATNLASLNGVRKAGYERVGSLQLRKTPGAERPVLTIESPQWSGMAVRLGASTTGG